MFSLWGLGLVGSAVNEWSVVCLEESETQQVVCCVLNCETRNNHLIW